MQAAMLAVLALGIYANTLTLEYALDDKVVLVENQFTLKGLAGIKDIVTHGVTTGYFGSEVDDATGGRYRPLSLVTHAIEYQFFGLAPSVSHLINVLCYTATVLLLFSLLLRLFPAEATAPRYLSVPFLAAAFFAAHPVHTEVVANIKGRDDLLGLLLGLGTLLAWLNYVEAGRHRSLAVTCLLFFLSLLAKESLISFLAVGPLILWYFERRELGEITKKTAPLLVTALVYVVVRLAMIGVGKQSLHSLIADPFLDATASQRIGTVALVWLLYLKLLVFPHPLTHDYYPYQIPLVDVTSPWPVISIGVYGVLLYIMVRGFRRRSVVSFCIATFFATQILYGNVLFNLGVLMNERFLYASSVAFCLLVAWLLVRRVTHASVVIAISVVLVAAGAAKTIARNRAWYDDTTLALTDVRTSSGSARAQMSAGWAHLKRALNEKSPTEKQRELNESIGYLEAALRIHPKYFDAAQLLGRALTQEGSYSRALELLTNCLETNPSDSATLDSVEVLAYRAGNTSDVATAVKAYGILLEKQPNAETYSAAGEFYGKRLGDLPKAREYLEEAVRLDPRDASTIVKLGVVHAMTGDMEGAVELFDRAITVDPTDAAAYFNKGRALRQMGQEAEGDELMRKATQMDPALAG